MILETKQNEPKKVLRTWNAAKRVGKKVMFGGLLVGGLMLAPVVQAQYADGDGKVQMGNKTVLSIGETEARKIEEQRETQHARLKAQVDADKKQAFAKIQEKTLEEKGKEGERHSKLWDFAAVIGGFFAPFAIGWLAHKVTDEEPENIILRGSQLAAGMGLFFTSVGLALGGVITAVGMIGGLLAGQPVIFGGVLGLPSLLEGALFGAGIAYSLVLFDAIKDVIKGKG